MSKAEKGFVVVVGKLKPDGEFPLSAFHIHIHDSRA